MDVRDCQQVMGEFVQIDGKGDTVAFILGRGWVCAEICIAGVSQPTKRTKSADGGIAKWSYCVTPAETDIP